MYNYSGFKKIIFSLLLVLFAADQGEAQGELDVIRHGRNNWLYFSDAPNALYHHLTGQAYDLLETRKKSVAGINSLTDWQKRQKWLKETLTDIGGPFPEKTPLNAQVLRVVKKDYYRAEHLVYESQPGFYVTASMFIPNALRRRDRAPVIIYCSGHTVEGYRSKGYQHTILNLVKKGFIVFAFDPVGQGERLEYYDAETGKSTAGSPTKEHSYPGTQAFITGSSQARYMIWDGIRAVDYLLTRTEVDPARIGITGRSGGGTQSSYIAAFDERVSAAAPECYITNFTRLLQSIGPQDAEQNLFNGIMHGLDHADLLAVRAPKPALMITTTRDMFSIQGARETAKEVSGIYKAYGKENNFSMVEDDTVHASTEKNREALYSFFQKHLNLPGNPEDEQVELLTEAEIKVTTTGQVSTSFGGETVFSLNRKMTEKLLEGLQASRNNVSTHLPKVLESAKKLSGYVAPEETGEPVFTGRIQAKDHVIEKYFIKGEGDYIIPYLLMVPDKGNNKAVIYLDPAGKKAAASKDHEMTWFVQNGFTVLAPDLIGIGEMGVGNFQGDAFIGGISHNIWYSSILIGRSIVGIQAGDIGRLVQVLEKNTGEIYGVAKKELSPALLHAAAFNPAIARIALIEPYASYKSMVMNRLYNSDFVHSTVPGALTAYDLPDLAASLAPRKLLMAGVTDGLGESSDAETMNGDFSVIKTAYDQSKTNGQLTITWQKRSENLKQVLGDWVK